MGTDGGATRKSKTVRKEPRRLPSDEMLFQPWFLSKRVQLAIRSLVPPSYWKRMRDFFDDYGCMICGTDQNYLSNGMCNPCNAKVRRGLLSSARRRLKSTLEQRVDLDFLRQARLAKKLLGRFSVTAAPRASYQRLTTPMIARVCAGKGLRRRCPMSGDAESLMPWSGG